MESTIPADDKLFAHFLISKIILENLKKLNLSFPPIKKREGIIEESEEDIGA